MEFINELIEQKEKLKKFFIKLFIFLVILFSLDRGIAYFLNLGLYKYFGLNQNSEILLVGHSHTVLGLDKVLMEKELDLKVSKYARSGANLYDRKAMIEQYYSMGNKPKILIYDVDAHLFTKGNLSQNSYQLFYPFMNNEVVNNHIKNANPKWQELLLRNVLATSRYSEMLIAQSARGHLSKWTNFKSGTVDLHKLKKQIENNKYGEIEFNKDSIKLFEETIEYILSKNTKIVLAYIPTIDILNNLDRKNYEKMISYYNGLATKYKNLTFIDFNKKYESKHELFFDPVHMNPKGQRVITEDLIIRLKNEKIN